MKKELHYSESTTIEFAIAIACKEDNKLVARESPSLRERDSRVVWLYTYNTDILEAPAVCVGAAVLKSP